MRTKSLIVADVSSKSLLYFDSSRLTECARICDYLKIDYLPIIGEYKYAERKGKSFEEQQLNNSMQLSEYVVLFDAAVCDKIADATHNVLFVVEGEVVKGVLHISDFNRNTVLQAIQHDFLTFERNLRQLLLLNEVSNETLLTFFQYKAQKSKSVEYWKGQENAYLLKRSSGELDNFSELQHFTLRHLLEYASSSFSSKVFDLNETINLQSAVKKSELSILSDLRNLVMHAKDSINMKSGNVLNSISQLRDFYIAISVFKRSFERLEFLIGAHPKHKRAIQLDNSSKLTIIDEHYPNAINFFIK